MQRVPRLAIAILRLILLQFGLTAATGHILGAELIVHPAQVDLRGNFSRVQLVVETGSTTSGQSVNSQRNDVTRDCSYEVADESVARISETGQLTAVGNGQTTVVLKLDENTHVSVPIEVSGIVESPVPSFRGMISPILSKAGCNMGACHASQYGKGGFVLSVFGFDPSKDWEAIVRDRQQRRISLIRPESSLFLLKPTLAVPHGGSKRIRTGSVDHQILSAWVAAGAPKPKTDHIAPQSLTVYPNSVVTTTNDIRQLQVTAEYANGRRDDVTAWAKFDSMDDAVLSVEESGLVETIGQGQATVMVRFEGLAALSTFAIPFAAEPAIENDLASWKSNNFVDELALKKFRELGLTPSEICDDATFLRRAYLDAIGSTPDEEEVRAFLTSKSPDKRSQLVDRLLGLTGDPKLDVHNDAYAAYWTLKWSDLIRNTSGGGRVEQAMWAMHNWIRESFRTNKPFDQFVKELVTAKGSIYMNGPANYFRINRRSDELAESTAQLFLGVRLQCAKCHHHPFEKYSQQDYYGMAAFFSRVGTKNSQEFGLFGRESVVLVKSTGEVKHPRTGKVVPPTPLGGEPSDHPLDRRIPLAEWLGSPENDLVARSVVNRYMYYLMGRGLVDPVDDMRATNPPSNVELMDRLASHFTKSGSDVKQLMAVIMKSRLYQLSSVPTASNSSDRKFYSYYKAKRLPAEPLLDAVDQATGSITKFNKLPSGTRAIELPDAEYPNYFLTTFAKPKRASVCECERMPDENLAQALHTLNGTILATKIADKNGRVARLLADKKSHQEIVESLYIAALCRQPTATELDAASDFLADSPTPRECYEDLLWVLLNSKQFLFNH